MADAVSPGCFRCQGAQHSGHAGGHERGQTGQPGRVIEVGRQMMAAQRLLAAAGGLAAPPLAQQRAPAPCPG